MPRIDDRVSSRRNVEEEKPMPQLQGVDVFAEKRSWRKCLLRSRVDGRSRLSFVGGDWTVCAVGGTKKHAKTKQKENQAKEPTNEQTTEQTNIRAVLVASWAFVGTSS